jgi:hypothetical protein
MTELRKSSKTASLLAGAVAFAVLFFGLRPFLDQDQSKVVLVATGFGIALAWYSILDLREKRGEGVVHTTDRLLRRIGHPSG